MSLCKFGLILSLPALPALPGEWQPSTAYAVGDKVANKGAIWQCVTAGTSAASGGPDPALASPVTDNTCQWNVVPFPSMPAIPSFSFTIPCPLDDAFG